MNSYKFNQWFEFGHINTFCCKLSTTQIATVLSLVFFVGSVSADLSTTPPHVIPKIYKEQTQTKSFIVKARKAISKNRLTSPKGNNALFYAKQLLALSPKDNDALRILNEISDKYVSLAYKRLRKYQINLAQRHHDKASKISRQFNTNFDSQKLTKLQQEITTAQDQISQLKSRLKKHIEAKKSLKKIKHKVKGRNFTTDKSKPPASIIQAKKLLPNRPAQNKKVFQEQYPSIMTRYYSMEWASQKPIHADTKDYG